MDRGYRFDDPEDHHPGLTGNCDRLLGGFHGSNDLVLNGLTGLTELTEKLRLTVLTEVFGLTKIFGLTGLTEVTEELGLTETGKTLRYALGLTLRLT